MKTPLPLIAFLVSCTAAASNQPPAGKLITAQGTLSQEGELHWRVHRAAEQRMQVQNREITTIAFAVSSMDQVTWCRRYEGKNVEVSGEVESVVGSTATIKLHTATLGEVQPSATELIRKLSSGIPGPHEHAPGQPLYRFAYYLSLMDAPSGCERCYVPLLITPDPLENAVRRKESLAAISITTYERDSIWQVNRNVTVTPEALDVKAHLIHYRGKTYRYEQTTDQQVLNLLENPLGTIPISRIHSPLMWSTVLSDLTADFHAIFRVRERKVSSGINFNLTRNNSNGNSSALTEGSAFTSELSVLDNGNVQYRLAPSCTSQTIPADLAKSHVVAESWNWRERLVREAKLPKGSTSTAYRQPNSLA